jgi:hypothetical protein
VAHPTEHGREHHHQLGGLQRGQDQQHPERQVSPRREHDGASISGRCRMAIGRARWESIPMNGVCLE